MTAEHAGVQLFPMTAVCFRVLQFRMFRMLGVIEHTALYGQNQDIRYAYVCAIYIRNRINTDGPALCMCDESVLRIPDNADWTGSILTPFKEPAVLLIKITYLITLVPYFESGTSLLADVAVLSVRCRV